MRLLLLYFLVSISVAKSSCVGKSDESKPDHTYLNQKKNFFKIGKEDPKNNLDINEINRESIFPVYESDPKKEQIKSEDVNKVDSTGYTPLLNAAMKNNLVEVKKLLLLGADPNIARYRDTPIVWAVHHSNKEMVSLLLSYGAEVIFRKDGKSDILVSLELDNDQDMLHIFLCHFARKGKKDLVGLSPIHWACRDGHLSVVQHLLEKSPDLVHNIDLKICFFLTIS